jgi:tyrosine decarboxylase / aspartate 1-decarboxylase
MSDQEANRGAARKPQADPEDELSIADWHEEIYVYGTAKDILDQGFANPPRDWSKEVGAKRLQDVLNETATRLQNNYPYHHPLYVGQMLKPPHPVARLAYALAMNVNPNNHAYDGGRATSAMEKEAVAEIARMFGWSTHLGHLCSGGTMANLEALWIAGQLAPGATIVASDQSHYTHSRISKVLHLPFEKVSSDARGRMDVAALAERLERGGVGTVVVTLGTTATGSVDPLPEILKLREKYKFRIHVDAAYGGYFSLIDTLAPDVAASFAAIREGDSIAIDPHKHGLQPYGCGCILFKDPAVGKFYSHSSPYTYFTSNELHLGEISLECSRPGAAAAALWATQRLLPLVKDGEFAKGLAKCRSAALDFHSRLKSDARFIVPFEPDLDLVIYAPRAKSVSVASALAREIFDAAAKRDLHLAVVQLPTHLWNGIAPEMQRDQDTITCLRSTMMKFEHGEWLDEIWKRLLESHSDAAATLGG